MARVAALALALVCCGTAMAGEDKVYRLGVLDLWGDGSLRGTMKLFMDTAVQVLQEEQGVRTGFKLYAKPGEFVAAMEQGDLDMVGFVDPGRYWLLKNRDEFEIIGTLQFYGRSDYRSCLYVAGQGTVQTVADLAGKTVLFGGDMVEYLRLWEWAGGPPEAFFGSLDLSPNIGSLPIALALGEVDGAVLGSHTIAFLEMNNPAMVKKFRQVACGPWTGLPLFLAHRERARGVRETIWRHLEDAMDHKAYARLRPLFRKTKSRPVARSPEDYEEVLSMLARAGEDGRLEAYRLWYRYASRAAGN